MAARHAASGRRGRVDFEARLSTVGIVNHLDLGFRWRMLGDEELSLAARIDASGVLAFEGGSDGAKVGGMFGATPGVQLSAGGRQVQFSAGLDVPLMMATGQVGKIGGVSVTEGETSFAYAFRPWLGLEFPIAKKVNVHAQAQLYMTALQEPELMPTFALGASW